MLPANPLESKDGTYRCTRWTLPVVLLLPRRATHHVHVAHPDGEAKFWLTPVVHLATSTGLSPRQITDAQGVVQAHMKEIEDAWNHHFGG